jgi:hypothetical protein
MNLFDIDVMKKVRGVWQFGRGSSKMMKCEAKWI